MALEISHAPIIRLPVDPNKCNDIKTDDIPTFSLLEILLKVLSGVLCLVDIISDYLVLFALILVPTFFLSLPYIYHFAYFT